MKITPMIRIVVVDDHAMVREALIGLVTLSVHVGIAAWMLRLTTGHVERPRLWSLCGFLFGLSIPVFYYIARIIHAHWPNDRRAAA